jgi:hypothetical protein
MLDALSTTDIISLIILILIAIVVLRYSMSGGRSSTSPPWRGPSLTGGAQLEPDLWFRAKAPTDTNDAVLLAHDVDNRYTGPDQAALAVALLDDSQHYDEVIGHVPADLPAFLDPSFPPKHLGSSDPAALATLVLLDPTARFGEEVLDDPPQQALPFLRILVISLIVLSLLYRLFFL